MAFRNSSTMPAYVTAPGQFPKYTNEGLSPSASSSTSSSSYPYTRSSRPRYADPISPNSQEPSLPSDTGSFPWSKNMPEAPAPGSPPDRNYYDSYDYRKPPPHDAQYSHYYPSPYYAQSPQYNPGYFPSPDPMAATPPMHAPYGQPSPPTAAGYPAHSWYPPPHMTYGHQLPPHYPQPPARQPYPQPEADYPAYHHPAEPIIPPQPPTYYDPYPPSRRTRHESAPEVPPTPAPAPAEQSKKPRGGILKQSKYEPKHEDPPPFAPAPPKTPAPDLSQISPAPTPSDTASNETGKQRRRPPPGAFRSSSRPAPRRIEDSHDHIVDAGPEPEPKLAPLPIAVSVPAPPPPPSLTPAPPADLPPPEPLQSGYASDDMDYPPTQELYIRRPRRRVRSISRGRRPSETDTSAHPTRPGMRPDSRTRSSYTAHARSPSRPRSISRPRSKSRRGRHAATDISEYARRHRSRSRYYADRYDDDEDREPLRITQGEAPPPPGNVRRSRSVYRREELKDEPEGDRRVARRSKSRRALSRPGGDRRYESERERRKRKEREAYEREAHKRREEDMAEMAKIQSQLANLLRNPTALENFDAAKISLGG
ncbi:hypothetical protein EX30DRAFT_111470 [Ascodesmis nigricans]|uniref:Uncharacterized protein n=1 Tax=Ascodesmis nigricans TaxID=341454 RepID=A0A4S2MQ43_9PEZI|nr:hypothetical protein EX30DRAFT_111470 [Ascodesmis nigricans]